MDEQVIWALEEQFWLKGQSFYAQRLDPACVMAFPGIGLMRATEVLDSLKQAPRWASVEMLDRSTGHPGDQLVVLGYTATAQRDGREPYRCYCTSTYRYDGEGWMLIQHQQTLAS